MAMDIERQWFIIGRWQEYEGEGRANLLRTIALGVFYLVELYSYYWHDVRKRNEASLAGC